MGYKTVGSMGFAGGLIKGIADGILRKKQEEKEKPVLELEKQLLQAQMTAEKTKQQKLNLMNSILQHYFKTTGQTQVGPPEEAKGVGIPQVEDQPITPMGESFSGQIAGMQLEQMNPIMAMMLQQASGMDFPKVIDQIRDAGQFETSEGRRRGQFEWNKAQDIVNYMLKLQETHPGIKILTPEGREIIKRLPKYGGVGSIELQTKPPTMEKEIPTDKLSLWVHPDDLSTAKPGMTAKEAKSSGFVRTNTQNLTRINDFRAVNVLVNQIEDLMEGVIPKQEKGLLGRVGGIKRWIGANLQTNPDAARLQKLLQGTQAALVRMFEKGTLTDKDIQRAKKLNIDLLDLGSLSWKHLDMLKGFISELQRSFLVGVDRLPMGGGIKTPPPKTSDKDLESILFGK